MTKRTYRTALASFLLFLTTSTYATAQIVLTIDTTAETWSLSGSDTGNPSFDSLFSESKTLWRLDATGILGTGSNLNIVQILAFTASSAPEFSRALIQHNPVSGYIQFQTLLFWSGDISANQ